MESVDLDKLFPDDRKIDFTALDGRKMTVRVAVTFSVGAFLIDNAEKLADLLPAPGQKFGLIDCAKNPGVLVFVLKLFKEMLKEQYEDVTEEWIKRNISLPKMAYILFSISKPIFDYLSSMGIVEGEKKTVTGADASDGGESQLLS